MVFSSLTFIVFFSVVLALYRVLPSWSAKKALLLVASYVFYGAWNPPFVLLLLFSTVVDYWAALKMASANTTRQRKTFLAVSLVGNLGLLAFFKYGAFAVRNFSALMQAVGVAYQPVAPDIVLPVGISFYTFQTLSYTIDVYRGQLKPARSFLDFAVFVSFFPQLVAGPIVRAADFLYQLEEERYIQVRAFGWGVFLMTLGLFQKVVLADGLLSESADAVFGSLGPTSQLDSWLGVIAFAGQIFCDFAGYSTCAIGVALCFGFHLVDNFHFPYAAVGFRDFWRRWHMSLSTWLRDYLYIPLGGNRGGRARTNFALMATMLLGGLWHGASWNFVVWGALHGLFLVAERGITRLIGDAAWAKTMSVRFATGVLTFALVCIAWVFFRARDLPGSAMIVASMLGAIPAPPILPTLGIYKVVGAMFGIVGAHIWLRNRRIEELAARVPSPVITAAWAVMLFSIILMQGAGDAFIYFQF